MFPEALQKAYIPSIYDSQTLQPSGVSFGEFLLQENATDLVSFEAIRLYLSCLPLGAAVDMRARTFSNLRIKLFNKKAQAFVEEDQMHPVLELLEQPNSDQTRREFLYAYSAFHDITGNSYLTVNAMNENLEPLEIFVQSPVEITIIPSTAFGTAGFVGQYLQTNPFMNGTTFTLDDTVAHRFRYFSPDKERELWHVRNFNPLRSGNNLFGTSPAQPIWLEIQQYIEGNSTNFHSLRQGVRPSGMFSNISDKPLTEDQWGRLQEMVSLYTGATGAGRAFAGDGIKFEPMQIPNREMEFRDLQSDMFERISYRFNIPLPLMSTRSMTYNNLSTSLFQFYDLSVIPLADRLLEELSIFLMRRYKGSENLELRFDPAEVSALKLRTFEEAKAMRGVNANSDNEIRAIMGYEEIDDGDVIWKPSMLVPAGMDSDPRFNDQDPPLPSKFAEMMLQTKKRDGEYYTEAEIYKIAKEEGLFDDDSSSQD